MQSMASFVSQNVGAGNPKRAQKVDVDWYWRGADCLAALVFALVMFRGDLLAGFFSTDAEVIQKGYDYLKGFALETIVTAVLFSMMGYFQRQQQDPLGYDSGPDPDAVWCVCRWPTS